jgi:hypothetical protein
MMLNGIFGREVGFTVGVDVAKVRVMVGGVGSGEFVRDGVGDRVRVGVVPNLVGVGVFESSRMPFASTVNATTVEIYPGGNGEGVGRVTGVIHPLSQSIVVKHKIAKVL